MEFIKSIMKFGAAFDSLESDVRGRSARGFLTRDALFKQQDIRSVIECGVLPGDGFLVRGSGEAYKPACSREDETHLGKFGLRKKIFYRYNSCPNPAYIVL